MKKATLLLTMLVIILSISIVTVTVRNEKNVILKGSSENVPIINVTQYPGETDAEKIQNALNAVPPEGAIVFIPEGTWEACNLTAKSNTWIMGTNRTVIKRPANTTLPIIKFINCTNFSVSYVIIDGQNVEEARGIYVINCTNFSVYNNTFINIKKTAIRVVGCSENFAIKSNIFEHCNDATILLFGSPSTRIIRNFRIENNTLLNGEKNGKIGVAFSTNGIITKNKVINCEYGIATRNVSNITIIENEIINSSSYAIYLGTQICDPGTDNIFIGKNQIINCQIGIARYYGEYPIKNVTVESNIIIKSKEWDIYDDFPAFFVNNTITSIDKLKILTPASKFIKNKDINQTLIQPGDVDGNNIIDISDVSQVAIAYGKDSENGQEWNPSLDIIQDGKIDISDVSFVAANFGTSGE